MDLVIGKNNAIKRILTKFAQARITSKVDNANNGKGRQPLHSDDYLKSIDYFRQRYLIEQRRAERGDYEFVLIIMDLHPESNGHPFGPILKKAEQMLLQTAQMVLRMTDVAVSYFYGKIAIILPDTTVSGANLAIERIKSMLNELATPNLESVFMQMKIDIYSYPSQSDEINQFIYDRLLDDNQSTAQLEKTVRDMKSYFYQRSNNNTYLRLPAFVSFRWPSSLALTIDNPFCWLNQVFEDLNAAGSQTAKRVLDVILSLLMILLLLPLMVLIAVAIKLSSPGPVIYRQTRVGFLGKKFMLYKFRTMYYTRDETPHKQYVQNFILNSGRNSRQEDSPGQIYKMQHDRRITAIGKLLRRTSLDEIPQLFNVLQGDMSLVGPRPPLPYEVDVYNLWHRRRYLTVKPGLTGLWQVYGRSRTTFDEMVRLDLAYINNWSLGLDLKILLKTLLVPFKRDGAY
ncbi:MAG: sugar transferase [candidate division KSB1 bacterium]|nr:sugar transferase [candidate division KSB1 bacterium]